MWRVCVCVRLFYSVPSRQPCGPPHWPRSLCVSVLVGNTISLPGPAQVCVRHLSQHYLGAWVKDRGRPLPPTLLLPQPSGVHTCPQRM